MREESYLINNSRTGIPDRVRGKVIGFCGMRYNKTSNFWNIDHVPSGLSMGCVITRDQAIRYLKALDTLYLNVVSRASADRLGVGRQIAAIYRAVLSGRLITAGSRTCSF